MHAANLPTFVKPVQTAEHQIKKKNPSLVAPLVHQASSHSFHFPFSLVM
jgi:hypothetical protein